MRINQIMLVGGALISLALLSAPLGLSLAWLRSLGPRWVSDIYRRRSAPNWPAPKAAKPGAPIRLRHLGSRRAKPLPRGRRMP